MATHGEPETEKPTASDRAWIKPVAIGIAAIVGAIVLAPYVLPAIGLGSADIAEQSITVMHSTGTGSGIAGAINSVLASVPGIGGSLSQGGFITAIASGAVGIGGVLLGNHLQKNEDGSSKISFGKLLKTAALLTSALIALPSLLTGLGIGLVYLCGSLGNTALASSAASTLYTTLGTMGGVNVGPTVAAGAFSALPHIITCGTAIIPTAVSLGIANDKHPATSQKFEDRMHPSVAPEQNPNYTDGSITATMEINAPLIAGRRTEARLKLTHKATGLPVTTEELAVNFTKKMHLFVVDQSLKDYHHIHPTPSANAGEYTFSFTPQTPNTYNAWADIKLQSNDKSHRLKTTLPCALERNVRAYVSPNTQTTKDGMNFSWKTTSPLRKDTPATVEVTVTDSLGNPVTDLQPIMGSFAHMVGFSSDGKSIVHTHPMNADPQGTNPLGGPKLRFHIEPDFNGSAQFYLQVKRNGQETYASFGQQVNPPLLNAHKVNKHQGHANHAMG